MSPEEMSRFPAVPGWIYCLVVHKVEESFFIKVGGTARDPHTRMHEICAAASDPQLDLFDRPYIFAAFYVDNVWQAEHLAHQLLWGDRVSGEIFNCDPHKAVRAISGAIDMVCVKAA